eukprot:2888551-Rhodomonas_salina.1
MNPWQELKLYGSEVLHSYRRKQMDHVPPHVFAIAEAAFANLQSARKDQTILVSGDSGSGKTESTKFMMQYLAAVAHHTAVTANTEQQVLQCNPVLEAFGNAKTLRNDNSRSPLSLPLPLPPCLPLFLFSLSPLLPGRAVRIRTTLGGDGEGRGVKSGAQTFSVLETRKHKARQTERVVGEHRFGKYIDIHFDERFALCGAKIDTYLLEKSRVRALLPAASSSLTLPSKQQD